MEETDPYVRLLKKAQTLEQKVFDKKRKAVRGGGRSKFEAIVRKNDLDMKIYANEFNKRKKEEEDKAKAEAAGEKAEEKEEEGEEGEAPKAKLGADAEPVAKKWEALLAPHKDKLKAARVRAQYGITIRET